MAEYSTAYTTNTTDITAGTEVYKFSRVVSTVNPSAIDNSCIYCGSENPVQYDYYPTYNYGSSQKSAMDSKWQVTGTNFAFTKHTKDTSFNICFALCDYTSTADESGRNSIYQIGKTIYNEAQSSAASNIRVLNPLDIRKLIFYPQFTGFQGTSMSVQTVDLKYLIEHKDTFYVNQMTMMSYVWNGSNFTSTPTRLNRIRPCIIGDNYFLPLMTVLANHVFQTTDYNSQKTYSNSFFGAYDSDGMGIDYFPIMSDESLIFTTEPATTNLISQKGNKFNCNYNYYVTDYKLYSPASQVIKLLAYCGCYFMDNSYVMSGKTLTTMWNDDHIYLGEMTEGARTTGKFIKGSDLLTSDTINKGSYSSQTDFTPGGGGALNDKIDDMNVNPLFGLNSDAGFAAYWLLTSQQLSTLHTWLTTTTFPDGYDPYSYIVSLIQFPLKLTPGWCLTGTSGNIHIGGEDTGISSNLIGAENVWKGLGTFNVPRENGNFLDYSPYSQYELYIPCCGWVSLPDIVAGHKIGVRVNYDLTTAAIIGNVYVYIDDKVLLIASKSGMMGRETVIAGESQGVRSAAITSALFNAGTGAINVAAGIMSGNAVAAVSGTYSIAAGLSQANIASNSSYVRQIGSTGGRALLCQYDACYLHISATEADIPSYYGHTVGYICNRSGKVKDFRGFTVFENFDTSGLTGITERERSEIKRLMESGIIINDPPAG